MRGTVVYFDIETGGLKESHPITQVAAVAVRGGVEVGHMEARIEFEPRACDPEALALNGYSKNPARWSDAIPERAAMRQLDQFCEAHADLTLTSKRTGRPYTVARLAGHNIVAFDIPRVRAAMERAGVAFWRAAWWYPLDTYQLALWTYATREAGQGPSDYTLEALSRHLGIQSSGEAHDALVDVRTCARVAEALLA